METCDACGPGTEALFSFLAPQGPLTFCGITPVSLPTP
jgi:hypothetical protein